MIVITGTEFSFEFLIVIINTCLGLKTVLDSRMLPIRNLAVHVLPHCACRTEFNVHQFLV